ANVTLDQNHRRAAGGHQTRSPKADNAAANDTNVECSAHAILSVARTNGYHNRAALPLGRHDEAIVHEIDWDENETPLSRRFGDPFFSRSDGRAETRHVFLGGNGLPARWSSGGDFTIAELGFGTGLNFLETVSAWRQTAPAGARLTYVAFERHPLARADLVRALARWETLSHRTGELAVHWPPEPGWSVIRFAEADLNIAIGDANELLPTWQGHADAWYLDGFSPAKNPDLWGTELMRHVFVHTNPGGTFATFTAAGWVRRNLTSAGFIVEKVPGFGRKRECLIGRRPTDDKGH
ncbi:MAG: tRNA (5-methylaminomethyl-2-thiouridine)(34)-methyltransferase MnmD, partial [Hyphomicrobiaceae bacterium]